MILTRGASMLRCLNSGRKFCNVRNMSADGYAYRGGGEHPSKMTNLIADVIGGAMWWWMLWHIWHEHEHITGEFPYPDTSKWTNEELGIPSD